MRSRKIATARHCRKGPTCVYPAIRDGWRAGAWLSDRSVLRGQSRSSDMRGVLNPLLSTTAFFVCCGVQRRFSICADVTTRGGQRRYSMRKKSNEGAMTAINKQPKRHENEEVLPRDAKGTLSCRDADRVEQALAGDRELARRYELVRQELAETIRLNELPILDGCWPLLVQFFPRPVPQCRKRLVAGNRQKPGRSLGSALESSG